jgi:hypothetical protein
MPILLLVLRANDRADRIDKSYPLAQGSFSSMPRISKYFKLPNFLALRSRVRIVWVVEKQRHLFVGMEIITLSLAVRIKLSVVEHV